MEGVSGNPRNPPKTAPVHMYIYVAISHQVIYIEVNLIWTRVRGCYTVRYKILEGEYFGEFGELQDSPKFSCPKFSTLMK